MECIEQRYKGGLYRIIKCLKMGGRMTDAMDRIILFDLSIHLNDVVSFLYVGN